MMAAREELELVVLGAGGHGAEGACYLCDFAGVALLGFIDEGKAKGTHGGLEVLGGIDGLADLARRSARRPLFYLTAVGNNASRQRLVAKIEALQLTALAAWTLVHPGAFVGRGVSVAQGTCIAPGSIVTTRATIGRHCIVNANASVAHDCAVGDFCNLNPGSVLCGNVTLGAACYIGAGAVVKEKISIGAGTIVGAGAVVVSDLPAGVTVAGVPARIIASSTQPEPGA